MEVIQGILEHYGIHTLAARTAEEALDILTRTTPDLIMVDLFLPGMRGWDLLEEIRLMPATANTPVVAMTAYDTAKVAGEASADGFDAYFSKPIDIISLVQELEAILYD
jgi:CheY-like chemotaxis protein